MKRPVYAIRDALNGFGAPFVDTNDASAKRNFAFAVNNNNDTMGFSPKDYDLYKLADFEHESGKFDVLPCPVLVVTGMSVFNDK